MKRLDGWILGRGWISGEGRRRKRRVEKGGGINISGI